jgi:hypothetical protein
MLQCKIDPRGSDQALAGFNRGGKQQIDPSTLKVALGRHIFGVMMRESGAARDRL